MTNWIIGFQETIVLIMSWNISSLILIQLGLQKNKIRDILSLKYLNKVWKALRNIFYDSYVDKDGKQHFPKQYEIELPNISNISVRTLYVQKAVDTSRNILVNHTIKLSTLITI